MFFQQKEKLTFTIKNTKNSESPFTQGLTDHHQ